jgi:membrane dipeptidase
MTKSRRDFLSNVAMTGMAASAATGRFAYGREAQNEAAGRPQTAERPHGGVHSILAKDHPYVFTDACMQIWPDADFANAHRHGVTAYAVTAWDPHDNLDVALEGLMFWHAIARKYPGLLVAGTVEDIRKAKREGKAALLLAAQGGEWIGGKLHRIEAFYRLGLRMMLLAYNRSNRMCDGCLDRTSSGLTRLGELVVDECNRVGVVLDCTHVGKRSTLEIIERSKHPCVYSHSNPSAIVPNPRNIDDEQIQACAARGGVIGLVTWGPLVMREDRLRQPTVDDFIDHIDHVAQMLGTTDNIGISTDMSLGTYPDHESDPWGTPTYPAVTELYNRHVTADFRSPRRNLDGFSDYPEVVNLADRLLARGYSQEDVRKFLGDNFLRVFEQVWT